MSFAYLTWAVVLFAAAAALAGDTVSLGNVLTEQCNFMVDGNRYDLCGLFKRNNGIWRFSDERETPPSRTTHQYTISFGGPLPKNESLADDEQCPKGTHICLTKTNRHPKNDNKPIVIETVPVAGELSQDNPFVQSGHYYPGVNATAKLVKWGNTHDAVLVIEMFGGYYVDQRQRFSLVLDCHPDLERPSLNHWEGGFENGHVLALRSKRACAQAADSPPSNDDDGSDELISMPSKDRAARKIWMILLSSACAIALVAYCIHSPPQRVRRGLQAYLRKHPSLLRFRVAESVLVRWAYEDLPLDENEEDVMVNGSSANYMRDDEQIPLKPSPRLTSVPTYGSAK